MITFTLDDATATEKMLEEEPERIVLAMVGAISEGVDSMVEQIRDNVSGGVLQRRTGTLEESVQPTPPKISGLKVDQDIRAGGGWAYYGMILEEGVEHEWLEENLMVGHPLVFEGAGETIFRTLAEHPAMPAEPWFYPTLQDQTPIVLAKVQEAINKELEK